MNSISKRKKVIQWIITICLAGMLCGGINNTRIKLFDEYDNAAIEENTYKVDYESVLENRLVFGEYGGVADFYVSGIYVDEEEMSQPKYDRFREFIEFYEHYNFYVQYMAYGERYEKEALGYLEKMQEISANSQFKDNAPYYQDIFNKVNGE